MYQSLMPQSLRHRTGQRILSKIEHNGTLILGANIQFQKNLGNLLRQRIVIEIHFRQEEIVVKGGDFPVQTTILAG